MAFIHASDRSAWQHRESDFLSATSCLLPAGIKLSHDLSCANHVPSACDVSITVMKGDKRGPAVTARIQGVAELPLPADGNTLVALLSASSTLYLYSCPGHPLQSIRKRDGAILAAPEVRIQPKMSCQVHRGYVGRLGSPARETI